MEQHQGNQKAIIVDIIKECPTKVEYVIVNEAEPPYILPVNWQQKNFQILM